MENSKLVLKVFILVPILVLALKVSGERSSSSSGKSIRPPKTSPKNDFTESFSIDAFEAAEQTTRESYMVLAIGIISNPNPNPPLSGEQLFNLQVLIAQKFQSLTPKDQIKMIEKAVLLEFGSGDSEAAGRIIKKFAVSNSPSATEVFCSLVRAYRTDPFYMVSQPDTTEEKIKIFSLLIEAGAAPSDSSCNFTLAEASTMKLRQIVLEARLMQNAGDPGKVGAMGQSMKSRLILDSKGNGIAKEKACSIAEVERIFWITMSQFDIASQARKATREQATYLADASMTCEISGYVVREVDGGYRYYPGTYATDMKTAKFYRAKSAKDLAEKIVNKYQNNEPFPAAPLIRPRQGGGASR